MLLLGLAELRLSPPGSAAPSTSGPAGCGRSTPVTTHPCFAPIRSGNYPDRRAVVGAENARHPSPGSSARGAVLEAMFAATGVRLSTFACARRLSVASGQDQTGAGGGHDEGSTVGTRRRAADE